MNSFLAVLMLGAVQFEVKPLEYKSMNGCIKALPFTISQTESKGVKVHGAACISKSTLEQMNRR